MSWAATPSRILHEALDWPLDGAACQSLLMRFSTCGRLPDAKGETMSMGWSNSWQLGIGWAPWLNRPPLEEQDRILIRYLMRA